MSTQHDWVYGGDVGFPDTGWMSQEEFQGKLNPPTQIIPTVESTSGQMRAAAGWRVARSLDTLLGQLNAFAPRRSKVSDGSIGDASHQTTDSDHNPWYGPGIVTARDYTHDPAGGLDGNRLANALVAAKDPRLKYAIWNRRIIDSRPGNNPWQWMPYHGSNPHDHHVHLSVMAAPSCDDTRPWALPGMTGPSPQPTPQGGPVSIWDRREQAWGGGVTDDQNNPYDLFEFGKRNNVEIRQARVEIAHLTDLVQTLLAEVAALKQAP